MGFFESMLPPNRLVLGDLIAGLVVAAMLTLASTFVRNDRQDIYINLAFILVGVASGWVLGIFLAPYTDIEKSQFTELAKGISIFASGYLVGKIDPLLTYALNPQVLRRTSRIIVFRAVVLTTSMLVTMIIVYVFRSYEFSGSQ
ncbi:MAG TPA: hypothetical protein VKI44_25990 [Acetobacteraceae bacterium]|nr:hypothetical protein [Acetobacteraceae bacterium]